MNYQESLEYLSRSYTYEQISAQTGVPMSTISYVIRGERSLPARYNESVKNAGYFAAYRELRDEGAGDNSALIIANESLDSIDNAVSQYQESVERYAKNWLQQLGRAKLNEEEGKVIYYNLDQASDKWRVIISEWNVSIEDTKSHSDDTLSSDPDWIHQKR